MKLFFDGGRNNGGITYCSIVYDDDGNQILNKCGRLQDFELTNNIAEYLALLVGIITCHDLQVSDLEVFGDSLLVINQVNGSYQLKAKHLIPFHQIITLLSQEINCKFTWIPREQNTEADRGTK